MDDPEKRQARPEDAKRNYLAATKDSESWGDGVQCDPASLALGERFDARASSRVDRVLSRAREGRQARFVDLVHDESIFQKRRTYGASEA